ncbi:aldehyde dehydrogenase family protein [Geodermatophilus ruber]|uniref:Acyl-CoA reductase n=1 Tax=Geodermatophilus ruber TaxID=504800 RepID=A0A1I4LFY0_9ACTN|nr:aldehyde dehydrogenase family protein [Geodermatophilus ruber]SFL89756.1 Acyl-CoA reductase [Geodermatophilus ruber]
MSTTDAVAETSGQVALPPGKLWIEGAWRDSTGSERRDVVDPATGRVVTTVPEGTVEDVDLAVAAARRAFESGPWATMSPRERGAVLTRAAQLIQENAEELARLESLDTGKPLAFARMIDAGTTAEHFSYFGGLAGAIEGATRGIRGPGLAYTRREPLGVVGAITPFNFPMILSTSKIAPALAAGNTVVHKPAEDTPLTALRIAELLAEAGLPAGVLNVVTGHGAVAGDRLVRHPDVDRIAFTGSTKVGAAIAAAAAANVTPVTMELGGKSANIVFEDANLDEAIQAAVSGFVFNTGQFCMGGTRLLVQRSVYDQVLAGVIGGATHVPVGDPLAEGTVVGPMAGQRHLENVERYVALADGGPNGKVVAGGQRIDLNGGFFIAPTVVTDVAPDSRLVQEEIFGPVLTVQVFDTEEEAIALANGTPYGLAAGLHTTDLGRAHRVAAQLEAGMIWVNTYGVLDVSLPFGGYKASGYGRENGPEALDEYLQTKSVYVAF